MAGLNRIINTGATFCGAQLQAHYSDVHVTSIAPPTGSTARAFSADTGMAECLVVATKRGGSKSRAAYFNLGARPSSLLEAAVRAKKAREQAVPGDILDAGAAGVRSMSVIEAARNLEAGNLRLPRSSMAAKLPVVTLGTVAERGLVHRDINGGPTDRDKTGPPQGPFTMRSIDHGEVPTYPMLWAHSADRERRFIVHPDSCGDPRPDDESRAIERWNHAASRLHANLDFRLNSQSLAMCLTPEKCLGGRAWPNIVPGDERHEIHCCCGAILHWAC